MIRIVSGAAAYFSIVFGVGFLLGLIRVPFLVPAVGERTAELLEMPVMVVAIFLSAKWLVRYYKVVGAIIPSLAIGILAAGILLTVEFSAVLWIRGISIDEFLADRDPIAAGAYYIAVAIFALVPAVLSYALRTKKNG